MLLEAGAADTEFLALAAGSTIAGNLTILGATSNIIIIQNAEQRGVTITFIEFLRFGILMAIPQTPIFLVWFLIITRINNIFFPCCEHPLFCKVKVQCDSNGRQNSA